MTVLTVFADAADDGISSSDNSLGNYPAARAGTTSKTLVSNSDGTRLSFGQFLFGSYQVWESFVSFDVSSIPAGATITTPVLSLFGKADNTTTDFTAEARVYDWGTTVTTADWVAGASLGALTRVATFASSGFSASGYNAFTKDGTNFETAIAAAASLRLVLCSANTVAGTAPTQDEWLDVASADSTGTTNDPQLVVTYTVAIEHDDAINVGINRSGTGDLAVSAVTG